jgi:diguanylate cyclase (GGDEF)-like protein/PAS domain S-box-containing protein
MARVQGRVATWSNRALTKIFGYEDGELDGHLARVLYLDDGSYERIGAEGYAHLQSNKRYRTQLKMRRKDGGAVWIDLSGTPVSGQESLWMFVDITAMKAREEQLAQLALRDPLTGLANRAEFEERLQASLAQASVTGSMVAVCYIDLDGFKAVNDEFGHAAGDQVLMETSRRIAACVRSHDTVTRLGGDEFAVVLSQVLERGQVESVLDRLLSATRQPVTVGHAEACVRASIGVAYAPDHGFDPKMLMQLADGALYRAKRDGKDRYCVAE